MTNQANGNVVRSLALLEQAREDVYFSQIDRELIAALHRKYDISENRTASRTAQDASRPELKLSPGGP